MRLPPGQEILGVESDRGLVQITARISRPTVAASTAAASVPGSMTMTSSSSPTIQVLLSRPGAPSPDELTPGDTSRSIRASMAACLSVKYRFTRFPFNPGRVSPA
jgi:hypothetical protein